ncbi:MAG: phage tail tape measure protein [Lactobacillaceae bacterium]|jgi:TP901 family phage tail tape measure protein|nr:phage tail tape measure protein [Lactobacillaceae bacterium]
MATNDVVVRAILDDSGFVAKWRNITREIQTNTSMWKTQFRELSSAGDWTSAYEAKLKGLQRTEETLKADGKDLESSLKELEATGKKGTAAWEKNTVDLQKNTAKLVENEQQQKRAVIALTNAKNGLQDIERRYESTDREMKVHAAILESNGNTYQANRVKLQGLSTMFETLTDKLKVQKQALQTTGEELGKNSNDYKRLEDEIAKTKLQMTEFSAEAKNLSRNSLGSNEALNRIGDSARKINGSLITAGQGMQRVGNAALLMSATMGFALAKGVKDVAELSSAYVVNANLLKTSGESEVTVQKDINAMRENGRNISLKYGISQKEIADGYEELIRRGYDGQQSLGAMNDIVKASIASGDSLSDTLKVTTSTLEGFGKGAQSGGNIMKDTSITANQLAFAADTTATNFADLGMGMSYVSQSAHSVNYSIGDTASALGILSNNGLEGQKAGTGLRKVITSLAAPTAQASKELTGLGVSVKDQAGNFRSLPDIFQDLHEKIKALPQDEQLGVLKKIFGQTGLQAAGILQNNFESLRKEMTKVNDSATATGGYIERLANSNMNAPVNQMKIFKQTVNDLGMQFSKELLPTITDLMKKGEGLMHWFSSLSDSTKGVIVNTALMGAGLGLAMKPLGLMVEGAGRLGKANLEVLKFFTAFKEAKQVVSAAKSIETVGEVATSTVTKVNGVGKAVSTTAKEVESAAPKVGKLGTALAAVGGAGAEGAGGAATMGAALAAFAGPAAIAVGVLGLAVGAVVLYNAHVAEMKKEQEKANEVAKYGTEVTKNQALELNNLEGQADAVQVSVEKLAGVKLDNNNINEATAAWKAFYDVQSGHTTESVEKNQKKIDALNKLISNPATSDAIKQAAKDQINALNSKNFAFNASNDAMKKAYEDATSIIKKAADENRVLSKQEMAQIDADKITIVKQHIETMDSLTKQQKADVEKMFSNENLTKMPMQRLQQANKDYAGALKAGLADDLNAVNEEIKLGISKADAWGDFFTKNAHVIDPMTENWNAQLKKIDWADSGVAVEEYGKSYDSMKKSVQDAGMDWGQFSSQFHIATKQQVEDMTTTIGEQIAMRDAFGDTAAKAIAATDEWNNLTPEQKAFIANDKATAEAMKAIVASKNWNDVDPDTKKLIMDDLASGKITDAEKAMDTWNALHPSAKKLTVNSDGAKVLKDAGIDLKTWNGLTVKQKKIIANDLASGNIQGAKDQIDSWNKKNPKTKEMNAHDNTNGPVQSAENNVNSPKQRHAIGINAKNNTAPEVNSASNWVNGIFQHRPIGIAAVNGTGGPVTSATNAINGIPNKNSNITATEDATKNAKNVRNSMEAVFSSPIQQIIESKGSGSKKAIGASIFEGGGVWLGDGGKNEPYLTPGGRLGVSPSSWTNMALPQGTKIWPSISAFTADTGHKISPDAIPRFATGGTINNIVNANDNYQRAIPTVNVQQDNSIMISLLQQIADGMSKEKPITNNTTYNVTAKTEPTERELDRLERLRLQKQYVQARGGH